MRLNQFLIAPYIGDGSPVAQTMWVDNLTVATDRVTNLLRNDEITSISPVVPALSDIFTGRDINSLDYFGPLGTPVEGEGSREGTNGSDDEDDLYRRDFPPGGIDPDLTPVIGDTARPLIFYQVAVPTNTLRNVKAGESGRISY